jgi:chromosome partitioning protein
MTEPDDAAWIAAAGAPRAPGQPLVVAQAAGSGEPTGPEPAAPDRALLDSTDVAAGEASAAAPTIATPATASASTDQPAADADLGPTGRPWRRVPEPAPLSTHGPARVIAVCNQKGGVGKTTSTINLGAALAEYGRRVLLVDLDPQGALSAGLGVASHELDRTIYNLMLDPGTTITDVMVPTRIEGVDLMPANIDLSAAEVQLINEVGREQTLARALRPLLTAMTTSSSTASRPWACSPSMPWPARMRC